MLLIFECEIGGLFKVINVVVNGEDFDDKIIG